MQVSDFSFDLPEELIASFPLAQRSDSRLLCLDGRDGAMEHRQFKDLVDLLLPGDLLVFNNTRVIPARLFGEKETGGKVEVLIERVTSHNTALAHVRSSRSPKPGAKLLLEGKINATVEGRQGNLFELSFQLENLATADEAVSLINALEQYGHMPLPPYMKREDQLEDRERYQTVYNEKPGAVAAPTAGLHFDQPLFDKLSDKGVATAFVTLHVGAGTFQPVKVETVTEHVMHAEYIEVSPEVCEKVKATKAAGGRVIAVGTTSVRCLESAAKSGEIAPFAGDTSIFIYPGYEYQVVDRLITNFHLPESTLLMLVSAFAGFENTINAYRAAVAERYRFFSYGDAMFITPQTA